MKRLIPDSTKALAFRYRGGVWTLFFVVLLIFARPSEAWLVPGLLFLFLGQGLRFWGAGTITRYRGEEVAAPRLVTWGPYAFARNPLYVGNGFIGLGWCFLSGRPVSFVLFTVVFVVLYGIMVVPWEEAFLIKKFPREYVDYKQRTGRFFPYGIPRLDAVRGPFDWLVLWKSERHSFWVTCMGTIVLFSRRWW